MSSPIDLPSSSPRGNSRQSKKRSWLFALASLLTCVIFYSLYVAFKASHFTSQTEILTVTAKSFPSHYTVGKGVPITYVSLGDGAGMGLGANHQEETLPFLVAKNVAAHGFKVRVENQAMAGARLADVVKYQLPKIAAKHITLATVSISAEDAHSGANPGQFALDLESLLSTLAKRKVGIVLLTTVSNLKSSPAVQIPFRFLVSRRADNLSALIRKVGADHLFVHIVDLNRDGALEGAQYASDGFHPSADGYQSWFKVYQRQLDSVFR